MDPQPTLNQSREKGADFVLAVVYKDVPGLFGKVTQPIEQLRLVRVAALARHAEDAGIDRHGFIE